MDACTILLGLAAILCSLLLVLYKWLTSTFNYFKNRGIPGPEPEVLFGTIRHIFKQGQHRFDMDNKQKYGDIVGTFSGRAPLMVVYDLDILKHITIKDFAHFPNRKWFLQGDPIIDNMIHTIQGDHWRHVRTLLTPTFSSGRLRSVCRIINVKAASMVKNLKQQAEEGASVEVMERCGAFTMDTIAGTAFGMDIDSQAELDNPFVRHASKFFDAQSHKFRAFLILCFPELLPYLTKIGIGRFESDAREFFVNALQQAIRNRKADEDSDKARDFLQLMLNAHKEQVNVSEMDAFEGSEEFVKENNKLVSERKGLSEDEVLAQGMIVMIAGHDTTATSLAFFFYLMANHQDIQQQVFEEITQVMQGHQDPTYDLVTKMKYLDQCLEETLRIYPPVPRVERECVKDVTINGVFFPKGMYVAIPIYTINMDPDVYPEPARFDPDRFSAAEKAKRSSMSWMTFGMGPRMCLGMRLAWVEMKVCIVHMMRAYKFQTCADTPKDIQFFSFATKSITGTKLKMEIRAQK